MSVPLVSELKSPPVIGKFYMVPCVEVESKWEKHLNGIIPILGSPHSDVELGVPEEHYHYDWRFMNADLVRRFSRCNGYPLEFEMAITHSAAAAVGGIQLVRLRCIRSQMEFPAHGRKGEQFTGTFINFERSYEQAELKCKRCPHRGIDLSSIAPNEAGVIVCPGHGLGWDAVTGKNVKRFEKASEVIK